MDCLVVVVVVNWLKFGYDVLVIDVGICVIYDFIDVDGVYYGGNIFLGMCMCFKVLNIFIDKFFKVSVKGEVLMYG